MSSFLKCPSCQSEVEVGEESVNQKVVCPKCGQVIIQGKTIDTTETEIELTPIPASQPAVNPPPANNGASGVNKLMDSGEDDFVLNSLGFFKTVNIVICVILCAIQFTSMMGCLADRHGTAFFAVPLFIGILMTLYICFLIHLAICWGRGVYRNLAWLRVIANKMPVMNNENK